MRMNKLTLVSGALAIAVMASPSFANSKPDQAGKNKPVYENTQSHKADKDRDYDLGERTADRLLTAAEKALIGDYYQDPDHRSGAKPLPPGIAKNLKRGKSLPPGIAKSRGDVPTDLLSQLRKRDGIKPSIVGTDVILEDLATGVLIDILRDVVR